MDSKIEHVLVALAAWPLESLEALRGQRRLFGETHDSVLRDAAQVIVMRGAK